MDKRSASTVILAELLLITAMLAAPAAFAHTEAPVARHYTTQPPAPAQQGMAEVKTKSAGCMSCHTQTDSRTMHDNPAVHLGCVDCHGGDAGIFRPEDVKRHTPAYLALLKKAHVLPRFPQAWNWPDSANPERTYTLLNREAPQFIRFVNPGDFRVAEKACGACHAKIIRDAKHSLMSTSAMFYGAAAYNNGLLPDKRPILGESYTDDGKPAKVTAPIKPTPLMRSHDMADALWPVPAWETVAPANHFRVFERGGINKSSLFPEVGLPNESGNLQTLELPGKPDIRQSNRGLGTGSRIATSVINLTKTRLNGPTLWFLGTNDQPGDYRSSGCSACHVVYANDREEVASGPYAKFGNMGESQTVDPTIRHDEPGHPLKHAFTESIPTSQCMVCHMHQPNMFLNSYLGYTMWAYTAGAPYMWPKKQKFPSAEEIRKTLARNPAGASPRGNWADVDFLKNEWLDLNPKLKHTQFADYHGHGWTFRGVYKKDREGHLLDAKGKVIAENDPHKWKKAVRLMSIHAQDGMHCVDCHFAKDNHSDGNLYGEVGAAVSISCIDCHGTVASYPDLKTSGPASSTGVTDMSLLRTPWGKKQFEWVNGKLIQRSMLKPELQWTLKLVKDTVNPDSPDYDPRAARAKLMSKNTATLHWGRDVPPSDRAHTYKNMECYTCHTSWTTSCGGCHLPIEANAKTPRLHYEGGMTRNYATYNPEVVRDQIFMLGKRPPYKGGKFAPVRSSSALVLSSTDSDRQHIYIQQAPISSAGFSSQAFNPHFPHTVRKTETKGCDDCHLSKKHDNNAIMTQLLGYGTHFISFIGHNLWVGEAGDVEAVRVTRWQEPQAVIGSYLDRYAYPDWYRKHVAGGRQLQVARHHRADRIGCLQLRGEYLYTANGRDGFRVYDVASIDNKGVSQPIITAPFSPLADNTHVATRDATCMALPTEQPIDPPRDKGELMRVVNMEQPFHPLYNYAFVTDAKEGLILVDVNTLADGDPRNNSLKRALTWNPDGILDGARHITIGGHYLYIMATAGLVIVDVNTPLQPRVVKVVPLEDGRASALQFRYLFVTDADGLQVIDVTHPATAHVVTGSTIPLRDPHRVYVARTYAYVADGRDGLAIVDIKQPTKMKLYQMYTADGRLQDARDVVLGTTDVSLFAYVADARTGVQVLQLTSPELQPLYDGFSPPPKPKWIATRATASPALSLSHGLQRDRAVDESGNQIAVFGRPGSRPLSHREMRKLYLDDQGQPWFVPETRPPESAHGKEG